MKLYILKHYHSEGSTEYFIKTNQELVGRFDLENPTSDLVDKMIKELDINYEAHREESLEFREAELVSIDLCDESINKAWYSFEDFKEEAECTIKNLNFMIPNKEQMEEAYEIFLSQPEEDPSGDIFLWTEYALSCVVDQQVKKNVQKTLDPLESHRKFFDSVIRPRLIEMAIDNSLPVDMTEIDFYHFEEAAKLQLQANGKGENSNPFIKYVEYNGNSYPTRTFLVQIPDEDKPRRITVSVQSLSDDMGDGVDMFDTEEARIDSNIYFYIEDEILITTFAKEICEKHLDTKIEFKQEIF